MKKMAVLRVAALLTPLLCSNSAAFTAPQVQGNKFGDLAFQSTWERTDLVLTQGKVKRSWYWGPAPNSGPLMEEYAEGVGGKRLVQYFDKSRMEINNPNADKSSPFYVTNGLLTRELITGKMQVGNDKFVLRWPARIPIVGDPSSPTYASLAPAVAHRNEGAVGKAVTATIAGNGKLNFAQSGSSNDLAKYGVKNVYFELMTRTNIPNIFSDFLNARGLIFVGGKQVEGRLSDPYFYVTGYPITDAYWTEEPLSVNGKLTPVLIQAYERRVLTYVPTNPEGFKVEMGNIGQHYYNWRYENTSIPPAVAGICPVQPTLGFGKLYKEKREVQLELGCALAPERRSTITSQTFTTGEAMFGIKSTDPSTGQEYEDVFALTYGSRSALVFLKTPVFSGPEPTPTETPPTGRYAPTGTLGKVWREQPEVRQSMNWAESPPEVEAVVPGQSGTGGIVQEFEGGWLIYPRLASQKIYVIYKESNTLSPTEETVTAENKYRWHFEWDTFKP